MKMYVEAMGNINALFSEYHHFFPENDPIQRQAYKMKSEIKQGYHCKCQLDFSKFLFIIAMCH